MWYMVIKGLGSIVNVLFHFQDELAVCNVYLACSEYSAISIKSGIISFMPLAGIKSVKIIFPVEIKPVCVVVICISLNEIEL